MGTEAGARARVKAREYERERERNGDTEERKGRGSWEMETTWGANDGWDERFVREEGVVVVVVGVGYLTVTSRGKL